jgi:aspartate ammonia-lyase
MGNDAAIVQACQAGQLELNVMMPMIGHNLLEEIEILAGGMNSFTHRCVIGLTANDENCRLYAEKSPSVATALNPYIGYHKAAELAKEALEKNTLIRDLALKKNIMDKNQLEKVLDLKKLTIPPEHREHENK